MSRDMLFGLILLGVALTMIVWLLVWSRRLINRLAAGRPQSVRQIVRELDRDA
jgi:hypothetical protein